MTEMGIRQAKAMEFVSLPVSSSISVDYNTMDLEFNSSEQYDSFKVLEEK